MPATLEDLNFPFETIIRSAVHDSDAIPNSLKDEALGVAREAAWKAMQNWDPSYGLTIDSYVRSILRHRLIDFIRAWMKQKAPPSFDPTRKDFQFMRFVPLYVESLTPGGAPLERKRIPKEDDPTEALIERMGIRQLFDAAPLSHRERLVLTQWSEGSTLFEIGDRLGVTESRISQIKSQAVGVLRRYAIRMEFD